MTAWSAKVDDEFDLLVTERRNLGPRQKNGTEQHALPHQRHTENRALPPHTLPFEVFEVRIGEHIDDVNSAVLESDAAGDGPTVDRDRLPGKILYVLGLHSVRRNELANLTVAFCNEGVFGRAEPRCRLDNCFKNRLQLGGRAADHIEHVARCGLIAESFRQLGRASIDLIEQSNVFDRDDRLVGEGLDELDLLLGERMHRAASQNDDPQDEAVAQQRDAERGPIVPEFLALPQLIFRIGEAVGQMNCASLEGNPTADRTAIWREGVIGQELNLLGRGIPM